MSAVVFFSGFVFALIALYTAVRKPTINLEKRIRALKQREGLTPFETSLLMFNGGPDRLTDDLNTSEFTEDFSFPTVFVAMKSRGGIE